jgi:tRNA (guanine-N(7)-)-methyltransferase subunit TRM82
MKPQPSILLSGNVLDVTSIADGNVIIISIDGLHEPGSTKTWKDNQISPQVFLQILTANTQQGHLAWEAVCNSAVDAINFAGTYNIFKSADGASSVRVQKAVTDSLYNIGNLRKRGQVGKYED